MEQIDRTQSLYIAGLNLQWAQKAIVITLGGVSSGEGQKEIVISGAEAETLMRQLNTANLTVISLHKRVLNYLLNNGHITGVISGLPDAP